MLVGKISQIRSKIEHDNTTVQARRPTSLTTEQQGQLSININSENVFINLFDETTSWNIFLYLLGISVAAYWWGAIAAAAKCRCFRYYILVSLWRHQDLRHPILRVSATVSCCSAAEINQRCNCFAQDKYIQDNFA